MKNVKDLREWDDFFNYFGCIYKTTVMAGCPLPEFFVADFVTFRKLTDAVSHSFDGKQFQQKHEWISHHEIKLFFINMISVSVKELAYCDQPILMPIAFPKTE
jgi:hypothetical protein